MGAHTTNRLQKLPEWDRQILENANPEYKLLQTREVFRQGGDGAYRDLLLISRSWGLDLDKLVVPVFMWHGAVDTLVPVSTARALAKMIPRCETHFIPEAGHQLLANEDVCSLMMGWVLSVGA